MSEDQDREWRGYADDLLDALCEDYAEHGSRVWSGAVELTPDQCQEILADVLAEWAMVRLSRQIFASSAAA